MTRNRATLFPDFALCCGRILRTGDESMKTGDEILDYPDGTATLMVCRITLNLLGCGAKPSPPGPCVSRIRRWSWAGFRQVWKKPYRYIGFLGTVCLPDGPTMTHMGRTARLRRAEIREPMDSVSDISDLDAAYPDSGSNVLRVAASAILAFKPSGPSARDRG